jgi:hypothetical protein
MIWALLVFLGVPLWLCALGIFAVIYRNRALRKRRGNIPVRILKPGKTRWVRGHAVWISDVFAWRGSPAAWSEGLLHVVAASVAPAGPEERKRLRRLGDDPVVATLTVHEGTALRVAAASGDRAAVLGPFPSMPDRNTSGPMK